MVRRKRLLAWGLSLSLCLAGCDGDLLPKAMNIAEIQLMRTMAVDAGEEEGWKVTVCGDLQKESTGGEARPPILVTRQGKSVFSTVIELERTGEGNLEFGHMEECVIGEEAARRGIGDLTDYLERDYSLRTGTKLFVVREDTGENILQQTASAQLAPTDWLTSLSEDQSVGGDRWPYLLRNYSGDTEDNGAALMPVLTLLEQESNQDQSSGQQQSGQEQGGQQDQPQSELALAGLAWFQEEKLAGYLNEQESQGASLLTGNDQLDAFEVPLSDGGYAGVQLVRASCAYRPVFGADGTLEQVIAQVTANGKLNQLPQGADPQNMALLREIRQGFRQQIAESCQAAIHRSQKENTDFLHIRRALVSADGFHMEQIEGDWEGRFPTLKLTVEVRGEVGRSYDTDRPAELGEG